MKRLVFMCLFFLLGIGCETLFEEPSGTFPADFTTQSDCMEDSEVDSLGEDDDVLCPEVLRLDWDGGVLRVNHDCHYANCAFSLATHARQEMTSLTVFELSKSSGAARCMCYFDLESEMVIKPGDFYFELVVGSVNGDQHMIFADNLSFPKGKNAEYAFEL